MFTYISFYDAFCLFFHRKKNPRGILFTNSPGVGPVFLIYILHLGSPKNLFYPVTPVLSIPWISFFWPKRKIITSGIKTRIPTAFWMAVRYWVATEVY